MPAKSPRSLRRGPFGNLRLGLRQAIRRGRNATSATFIQWAPKAGSGRGHPTTSEIQKMKLFRIVLAAAFSSLIGAAFAQGGPNDAQIAHIVVTANQVDIDAGKLAEKKAHSKEVKAFGKQMVTDHSGVNKQAVALAKKLGVKPENNDTSKALKAGGEENVKHLKSLKGAAFDKAYVDHEVAYHEQVLDAIDKVLIPNAQNAELKGLIEKVRPAFVAHLEHAKMLQSKLNK
jgi:putative membrane protein